MSFSKSTVKQKVDELFTAFNDIKYTATLTSDEASTYDFDTGVSTTTPSAGVTADVLLIEEYKDAEGNRAKYKAVFKTSQIDDLEAFDKIMINGSEYRVAEYKDNGFTIEAVIVGTTGGINTYV
jgi:hypothetical protein